jgi:hypothetical protein
VCDADITAAVAAVMLVGLVTVLVVVYTVVTVTLRSYSSLNISGGLDLTAGSCGHSCS